MPDKKIRILVTGFTPFDDAVNISGEVVKRLHITHPNVEIIPLVLTSQYRDAQMQLSTAIHGEKPDFVICLGEANWFQYPGIQVETLASSNSAIADALGDAPHCMTAQNDMLKIHSSHPILKTVLQKSFGSYFPLSAGVQTDNDAGSFVCNDTFYHALKLQQEQGLEGRVLFLHLQDIGPYKQDLWALAPAQKNALSEEEKSAYESARIELLIRKDQSIDNYTSVVRDLIHYIGNNPTQYTVGIRTSVEPILTTQQEIDRIDREVRAKLAAAKVTFGITPFNADAPKSYVLPPLLIPVDPAEPLTIPACIRAQPTAKERH